jgi:hypothetical protein
MLRSFESQAHFSSLKLVTEKIMDFIITSKRQSPETSQPDQLDSPVLASSFSFFPS